MTTLSPIFVHSWTLSFSGLDSNNVPLVIERHGLEGNIQVTWSTGLLVEGVSNGTLSPPTGTFFMGAGTTQVVVNFTVSNHNKKLENVPLT